MFDHGYMERYWPRYANVGVFSSPQEVVVTSRSGAMGEPHRGIRYEYGDLNDVVEELAQDPTTRQAILPVFFPEDTGYRPGRRKPCSLHYHFMLNGECLDIQYVLRSCDLVRHFRDDIYLTVRLLLWMLEQLRKRDSTWNVRRPGLFVMHIANLHCFVNDMQTLKKEYLEHK
jgi:thymidylate synthase